MTSTPMAHFARGIFKSLGLEKGCRFGCQPTLRLAAALSVIVGCLFASSASFVSAQQGWTPPPTTPVPPPATVPATAPATAPATTTNGTPSTPTPATVPAPLNGGTTATGIPPKTTPFRASFSQPKQNGGMSSSSNSFTNAGQDGTQFKSPSKLPTLPPAPTTNFSKPGSAFTTGPVAKPQSSSPTAPRMSGQAAGNGFATGNSNLPLNLGKSTTTAATITPNGRQDSSVAGQPITKVSKSFSKLPSTAGQVWREYDITPYTSRITSVEDPQQAMIDWILLETGTDMWFHQPLGILSANRHKLFVYHTPEIQAVVSRIVDRMVNTRGQLQSISVNLLTIANPNWRSEAYPVMQPIDVRSPGVEAWMVSKENAAYLLANLRRRPDFQEHGNARLVQHDGQTIKVEKYKPLQFVQSIRWTPNQVPGYQPQLKTIDEGYALKLAALTSLDGKTIEATVECSVDQVEKLRSVKIAIPGAQNTNGAQVNLQIPQMVSWEIKERFRWPNDQVLVLSCGVVANPKPKTNNSLIPDLFEVDRGRADALLFIEYRGPDVAQLTTQPQPVGLAPVQRRQ
ncbi:MAG: hypothetical protein P8K79_01535 [Mariniblastus sp.]|nr:hypothetical protein [Mariniblastus sp.]